MIYKFKDILGARPWLVIGIASAFLVVGFIAFKNQAKTVIGGGTTSQDANKHLFRGGGSSNAKGFDFAQLADVSSVDGLKRLMSGSEREIFASYNSGRLAAVVREWMDRDINRALELIAEFPDDIHRSYALDWSSAWFSKAPREFLHFAEGHLSPDSSRKAWFRVMAQAGKDCPETAMEIILEAGQGERKEAMLGAAFGAMAQKDPQDALNRVSSLPFPEDRKKAVSAIAECMSSNAVPVLSQAAFLRLTELERSMVGESVLRAVAADGGEDKVAELYESDPSLRQYGAGAVAALGGRDWKIFVGALDDLVQRGIVDYSRDSAVIGRGFARYLDSATTLGFVASLPDSCRSDAALAIITEKANSKDNSALLDVLRLVPAGPPRNAAAEPLLHALRIGGSQDRMRLREVERILAEK